MNWAALPRWAVAGLVYVLFGALPALAYLWDSPSETDAARAAALALMDAIAAQEADQQ